MNEDGESKQNKIKFWRSSASVNKSISLPLKQHKAQVFSIPKSISLKWHENWKRTVPCEYEYYESILMEKVIKLAEITSVFID